jgi:hypothetical protein
MIKEVFLLQLEMYFSIPRVKKSIWKFETSVKKQFIERLICFVEQNIESDS